MFKLFGLFKLFELSLSFYVCLVDELGLTCELLELLELFELSLSAFVCLVVELCLMTELLELFELYELCCRFRVPGGRDGPAVCAVFGWGVQWPFTTEPKQLASCNLKSKLLSKVAWVPRLRL